MAEDRYLEMLSRMLNAGQVSHLDVAKAVTDYKSAKRMRLYALISTIAAAVSALASAGATFLAYLSIRHQ